MSGSHPPYTSSSPDTDIPGGTFAVINELHCTDVRDEHCKSVRFTEDGPYKHCCSNRYAKKQPARQHLFDENSMVDKFFSTHDNISQTVYKFLVSHV